MIYRVLVFVIGLELLGLGLVVPDERPVYFVCAAIVHGIVLVDLRYPGFIEGVLRGDSR